MVFSVITIISCIFILYNFLAMMTNLPMCFLLSETNFIAAILHGCALKFSPLIGISGIAIAVTARFVREDTSKVEMIMCFTSIICSIFLIL